VSTSTDPTRSDQCRSEPLDPALVKLALAIVVGVVAAILDLTIVNVAIDTLQRRLHTSVSTIQWVSTGYVLAVAMTIPVSGWAFQRFGARRSWMVSLIIFVAGSALCGVAWSTGSLIAFRIFQGIGGGMLLPLAQTILANAAGRERLARIVPFIAIPSQAGPVLGPVIGGLILSNASWRWIFYVNVPVVLVALALAWRAVPQTEINADRRIDIRGLALLSPALALFVYGFSEAGVTGGFDDTKVIAPLAVGLAILAGYCVHALRSRVEPILNLRLLRFRGCATSSTMMFLSGVTLFGARFLLPLYYQQARGASALQAGLLLAPRALAWRSARSAPDGSSTRWASTFASSLLSAWCCSPSRRSPTCSLQPTPAKRYSASCSSSAAPGSASCSFPSPPPRTSACPTAPSHQPPPECGSSSRPAAHSAPRSWPSSSNTRSRPPETPT
jgi:MFS family permease